MYITVGNAAADTSSDFQMLWLLLIHSAFRRWQ